MYWNRHELVVDMHFMLQKEVVDRMAAGPGQPHLRAPVRDDPVSVPR